MKLTREKIIKTAISYADKHSLKNISMRKIASELGVQAMSLYNHIKNKEDLVDAMVEEIVSQIGIPEPEKSWRDQMTRRAQAAHDVLVRHHWATHPLVSRMNIGDYSLTYFDRTLQCLHRAGFSLVEADHAINAMDSYIFGFVLIKTNFPIPEAEFAKAASESEHLISEQKYPAIFKLASQVKSGSYNGLQDFTLGFNFIIDGLERILKEKRNR